jgi:hypothetical protein
MSEGLISNTLRNFTQKSNYNIMSIVGEVNLILLLSYLSFLIAIIIKVSIREHVSL